jgi:hypothetical protein
MIMSFILDALRKLEEKQSRETTRELLGSAGGLPEPGRKRNRVPIAAGLLLALPALVLAWFLLRGDRAQEEAVLVSATESASETSPPVLPIPGGSREEAVPVEAAEPSPAHLDPGVPGEMTAVGNGMTVDAEPLPGVAEAFVATPADALPLEEEPLSPIDEEPPEETADSEPPATSGTEAELPPDRLLAFEELPGDVRTALKELRISGHIYSTDPLLRRLNVNDGMWREGDTLSGGVVVEEVTESGAVFLYGGYRFSMGVRP